MFRRLIILMLFLGTACQSGIIPCPRVKPVKAKRTTLHKHFLESTSSLSAKASAEEPETNTTPKAQHTKSSKNTNIKVVGNVTPEEWDCPKPGRRKYMPKTVKQNIRKNLQKINSADEHEADSLATPSPKTIRK